MSGSQHQTLHQIITKRVNYVRRGLARGFSRASNLMIGRETKTPSFGSTEYLVAVKLF